MHKKLTLKKRNSNGKVEDLTEVTPDLSKVTMIQMLIPLGLKAVEEMLQEEVNKLVGNRYERNDSDNKRWGSNKGSVYLGDQKVGIDVPRVRNLKKNQEIQLESYEKLQSRQQIDDKILGLVINGISTRNYEKVANKIPETFGIKKSSISEKFVKASGKKLKEFNERDLSNDDIVAIFVDGKVFAEMDILVALGVDINGEKKFLGLIETATENTAVVKDFMCDLQNRGLKKDKKILFIIDGAKGLAKGIKKVFKDDAVIQRCQWHKRENVIKYLPKQEQIRIRKKLQKAYQMVKYDDAKRELLSIAKEVRLINISAENSLMEGFEETLTLHRLGVFDELGNSFKTTNCIENANRLLSGYTKRVSFWKNSNQRQRWVATSLLEIEPRMHRVKGCKHLKTLRDRLLIDCEKIETKAA